MEAQYNYPKLVPVFNLFRGQINAQDIGSCASGLRGEACMLITPERWDAQGHGYCRFLHVNKLRDNYKITADVTVYCDTAEEIIAKMFRLVDKGEFHELAHEGRINFRIIALNGDPKFGFKITAHISQRWDWPKHN